MTRRHATIEVSPGVFDEIAAKLLQAGFDDALIFQEGNYKLRLDMDGIGLVKSKRSL